MVRALSWPAARSARGGRVGNWAGGRAGDAADSVARARRLPRVRARASPVHGDGRFRQLGSTRGLQL